MIRVVLVDDEKWSLLGLQRIITWEKEGFQIVGTAENGIEALEMCRKLHPDLILTDIRMPGMDGLELARAVALELPSISVMLVTGYGDLGYAQQAIRLGVIDFLTKQVSADDLLAALRRFKDKNLKSTLKQTGELYFSYFSSENHRSTRTCLSDLCISNEYESVRMISRSYGELVHLQSYEIYYRNNSMYLLFQTGSCQITIISLFSEDVGITQELFGIQEPTFSGSSRIHSIDQSFYEIYRESIDALMSAKLWNKKKNEIYQEPQIAEITYLTKNLKQQIAVSNRDMLQKTITQIWKQCNQMQIRTLSILIGKVSSLLSFYGVDGYEKLTQDTLTSLITAGGTWEDIELLFFPDKENIVKDTSPVDCVLSYIETHFTEDLRISKLSEMFFINASYLSTMIRKKTGCTYSDIVLKQRIELAKKLLKTTDMSAQEIASECGYHDYSHFNSSFKKLCNCTPGQFRESINK